MQQTHEPVSNWCPGSDLDTYGNIDKPRQSSQKDGNPTSTKHAIAHMLNVLVQRPLLLVAGSVLLLVTCQKHVLESDFGVDC